jgi:hypothetical protein
MILDLRALAYKAGNKPLIKKFEDHCAWMKNLTYERYRFNTCTQDGRPFDTFLVDLINKAKICEFGTL